MNADTAYAVGCTKAAETLDVPANVASVIKLALAKRPRPKKKTPKKPTRVTRTPTGQSSAFAAMLKKLKKR